MDKASIASAYPDVAWGMHLVGYLDGLETASWRELESFQNLSGVEIPPGECQIIIDLGKEQKIMAYKARQKSCDAPFSPEVSSEGSALIVSNFTSRFKSS